MNDSATAPSFFIPTKFEGATLSTLAESIASGCPGGLPSNLVLDFQKLNFIQPAGVVFLSNLIWWLHQNGTVVRLTSIDQNVGALRVVSFSNVQTATSSFVNASFVPLLKEFSLTAIKTQMRVTDSTRQINQMIKNRLERVALANWRPPLKHVTISASGIVVWPLPWDGAVCLSR